MNSKLDIRYSSGIFSLFKENPNNPGMTWADDIPMYVCSHISKAVKVVDGTFYARWKRYNKWMDWKPVSDSSINNSLSSEILRQVRKAKSHFNDSMDDYQKNHVNEFLQNNMLQVTSMMKEMLSNESV